MREILSIFIVALTILSMSCKNETDTTGKYDDTNKKPLYAACNFHGLKVESALL